MNHHKGLLEIGLPKSDFRYSLIKEFLKVDRSSLKVNLNFKAKKILFSKQKNEKLIISLLKQLYGFSLFLLYNEVSDEILSSAIKYFKYERIPSGTYIFHQGESSDKFYGIIKGSISIQVRTKRIIEDDLEEDHKDQSSILKPRGSNKERYERYEMMEIMKMTEGMCFGEWAIIYGKERSASAYVLEESHLFSMSKEKFKSSFSQCLFKAENNRREFVKKVVPYFRTLPSTKFEDYYKRSVFANFFRRGQFIYKEGNPTGCLFAVYQGECNLEIGPKKVYKSLLSEKIYTDKINHVKTFKEISSIRETNGELLERGVGARCNEVNQKLLKLSVGGVAGLEVCVGITKLRQNCVAASEVTTILKIDLLNLPEKISIVKTLIDVFINSERIINSQYIEQRKLNKIISFNSCFRFSKKITPEIISSSIKNITYNSKFFDIDQAGFIEENKKNNLLFYNINRYYEIQSKISQERVPLEKENEYKYKMRLLRHRMVRDKASEDFQSKYSEYSDNNIKVINEILSPSISGYLQVKKKRKKASLSLTNKSSKSGGGSRYLSSGAQLSNSGHNSPKKSFYFMTCTKGSQDYSEKVTNSMTTFHCFSQENVNKNCTKNPKLLEVKNYQFNSGIFKLPFISLGNSPKETKRIVTKIFKRKFDKEK